MPNTCQIFLNNLHKSVVKENIVEKFNINGYIKVKYQMWDLLSKLGHLLRNGFDVPFNPEILIDIKTPL